ncbi:unnamed protein product, partial [Prorocentrum cordatum]
VRAVLSRAAPVAGLGSAGGEDVLGVEVPGSEGAGPAMQSCPGQLPRGAPRAPPSAWRARPGRKATTPRVARPCHRHRRRGAARTRAPAGATVETGEPLSL